MDNNSLDHSVARLMEMGYTFADVERAWRYMAMNLALRKIAEGEGAIYLTQDGCIVGKIVGLPKEPNPQDHDHNR